METNAGMDYAYTYPNAPAGVAPEHGVRQVTGGIGYNGTVTIRAKRGTGCTTSPEMKLYVNGTLREQWTVNKSSYLYYTKNTGMTTDAQVDVVFTNAYSGCTLQVDYVTIPTATGTRTVQAESGGTVFDRGAETGASGVNAFDGVNVINGAELMSENGSLRFVVGLNSLAAGYDANGNMTLRLKDGARYFLVYDAENRLTSVSGTVSASFAYNGDGQRVSATIDTTITTYIGGYFEWQGGAGTSYYFAGAQRIAMRTSTDLKYLLGDHLGSTAMTALASGAFDTETRYYPWGGVRWSSGTSPTDYMFTGQQEVDYINLYWYGSRWYDPALGRFVSPDTIVPDKIQGVQAWDRYAYVNNCPIVHTDPSGHCIFGLDTAICIAVGVSAVVGAIGGAVGYIAATRAAGNDIDYSSLAVAAGGGLIAGALAPIIAIAAPSIAIPATAAMYGGVSTVQYMADQTLHGQPIETTTAVASFAIGAATGVIAGPYTPSREVMTRGLRVGMSFTGKTAFQFEREAARRFLQDQAVTGTVNFVRNFVATYTATIIAPRIQNAVNGR